MDETIQRMVTKAAGGEYSTIRTRSGMVETMWFGEDGEQVTVGRTYQGLSDLADAHILEHRAKREAAQGRLEAAKASGLDR